MGITLKELQSIYRFPTLKAPPRRVLDLGSTNVYRCSKEEVLNFFRDFYSGYDERSLAEYAEAFALGSMDRPATGGINGSWLGDLLTRIGTEYVAYDLFAGYRTLVFDLNKDQVPPQHEGYFDLAINCGTTEHVLNQLNSFQVIHNAVRVGALIYHALPMTGYLNHGYFNYQPKLFFELAHANKYAIHKVIYTGPAGAESLMEKLVAPHASSGIIDVDESRWSVTGIPSGGVIVVLEKTSPDAFAPPLETSTTAWEVAEEIGAKTDNRAEILAYKKREQQLLNNRNATLEQLQRLTTEHARLAIRRRFSFELEKRLLAAYIKQQPDRSDLKTALENVNRLAMSKTPVLRYVPEGETPKVDNLSAIALLPAGQQRIEHILSAYRLYASQGRLDNFPKELERDALLSLGEQYPDDHDLWIRLGRVMSEITTGMQLKRAGNGGFVSFGPHDIPTGAREDGADEHRLCQPMLPNRQADISAQTDAVECGTPASSIGRELELCREQVLALENERSLLSDQIADLHSSTSWRLTAPLRAIVDAVGGLVAYMKR